MQDLQPVGVLDSGIGGLSVLTALRERMPGLDFIYVADSAHAPYGPKSADAVTRRCREILQFFISHNASAVVIACNTATAAAVNTLRQEFDLPIIGMEPALKPAAALTRTGVVGVLATEGTLNSDRFLSLRDRFARNVEAVTVACHGWVESIEKGQSAAERRPLLEQHLQPLLEKGADTLILGCTHYALIGEEIRETCLALSGLDTILIDTGPAVARELERRLPDTGKPAQLSKKGQVTFYTSGDPAMQQKLIASFSREEVFVNSLPSKEEPVQL